MSLTTGSAYRAETMVIVLHGIPNYGFEPATFLLLIQRYIDRAIPSMLPNLALEHNYMNLLSEL